MQKNIIQGKIQDEIRDFNTNKKVGEMLSNTLNEVKEKFKATEDDTLQVILSADESFENYKEEYEKSLEIVLPEIEPIGMEVITSAMLMNFMEHGRHLIGSEFNLNLIEQFTKSVSDEQVVVAIGPNCQQVKVGDIVKIRLADFTRIKNPNSVKAEEVSEVPLFELNGNSYLNITERNISYIFKTSGFADRRK